MSLADLSAGEVADQVVGQQEAGAERGEPGRRPRGVSACALWQRRRAEARQCQQQRRDHRGGARRPSSTQPRLFGDADPVQVPVDERGRSHCDQRRVRGRARSGRIPRHVAGPRPREQVPDARAEQRHRHVDRAADRREREARRRQQDRDRHVASIARPSSSSAIHGPTMPDQPPGMLRATSRGSARR